MGRVDVTTPESPTATAVRRSGLRPLSEALAYRDRHVVDRFVEHYGLPREEAEDLFVETLRWLWLCAHADGDPRAPKLFVDDCLAMLDEMWHTFVLFTREYTQFCDEYLGGYIHHVPTTVEQKQRIESEQTRDPEGFKKQHEVKLRAQYDYVYDELGEDVLIKWYSTYPDKYPPAFVKSASSTRQQNLEP